MRKRRTKVELSHIDNAMYNLVWEERPMSVRQVFYRMTTEGIIDKTEAEYKNIVVRRLGLLRKAGHMPFDWLVDATRWQRKPLTHSSLEAALIRARDTYRRALWEDQNTYVEIWLEKEALAGVLYPITRKWDVPLMTTRGYSSISFLHSAALEIREQNELGKEVYLYQFGDHDPSGVDIPRAIEQGLMDIDPELSFEFERVAVTPAQIQYMDLPTRPTKKSDTRIKHFGSGQSVELDAIPPQKLRDLVEDCIIQHIDDEVLSRTEAIEDRERQALESFVAGLADAGISAEFQ